MTRTGATANTINGGRIAAFAIALALFTLQAGTLLHQDQHVLAEIGDTCPACLQIEQFGTALAGEMPAVSQTPTEALSAPAVGATHRARPARAYASRAPPETA